MHTGRTPYKYKGRDQGDMSTSQGMPKIACKLSETKERDLDEILPHSQQREPTLFTPQSQISSLWNCEMINSVA